MQKSDILTPWSVQNAKYLHGERSLLVRAKKLGFGEEADKIHARASEMYPELFISEVKSDLLFGIKGTHQSEQENANKRVFMQAKACTQKQAFDVNAALDIPIYNFLQKFSYILRLYNFFTLRWRERSSFILDISILWSWPAK